MSLRGSFSCLRRSSIRRPPRGACPDSATRLHAHDSDHPRARHWREHGDLQPRPCRRSAAAHLQGARSPGPHLREPPETDAVRVGKRRELHHRAAGNALRMAPAEHVVREHRSGALADEDADRQPRRIGLGERSHRGILHDRRCRGDGGPNAPRRRFFARRVARRRPERSAMAKSLRRRSEHSAAIHTDRRQFHRWSA